MTGRTLGVFDWRRRDEWLQLLRYYAAGVVNTLFGYGCFAALVWAGLNIYLAQIIAHMLGTAFNYLSYSRYAFAGHEGGKLRFVASYGVNYLLSLAALWAFSRLTPSPYLAGLAATLLVSVLNYFVLKRFVFQPATSRA